MRPPIWLAADEPMCRGTTCTYPIPCARRLVTYTAGRAVADFSLAIGNQCTAPKWVKHVSLADAVQPVAPPVVKDWIGGLL